MEDDYTEMSDSVQPEEKKEQYALWDTDISQLIFMIDIDGKRWKMKGFVEWVSFSADLSFSTVGIHLLLAQIRHFLEGLVSLIV